MSHIPQRLACLLVMSAALSVSEPVASQEPEVMARVGDPAPGGGTYLELGRPQINESGIVAFQALVQHGPADLEYAWFLVDTYQSLQPVLALTERSTPDDDGWLQPSTAYLWSRGSALDFSGGIQGAAPMTGNSGWYVRTENGEVLERVRRGKRIASGMGSDPEIVCLFQLRRFGEGAWIVQTRLFETPQDCEGPGNFGPTSAYRIGPDHSVERLVGEGDAISQMGGATVGPGIEFYSGIDPDRFAAFWSDGSPDARFGLFRLGPDLPELEIDNATDLPGLGIIELSPSNISHGPEFGFLGQIRVRSTAGEPLRSVVARFDADGGEILLEQGEVIPGFGRIEDLDWLPIKAGKSVALAVALGESPGLISGFGVLSVDASGAVRRGARTGHAIAGVGTVDNIDAVQILPSGIVAHVVAIDDPWSSQVLLLTDLDGPRVMLPVTLELDGVSHGFDLPDAGQPARGAPINSREQIVALARPRGSPSQADVIVYFGGSIFAGDFELP